MTIKYDSNGYIVGGKPTSRVTPNFRLSELARADKSVFVHRDLIRSLQLLRSNLSAPIRIEGQKATNGFGTGKRGLFLWISATDMRELDLHAQKLVKEKAFSTATLYGRRLYVEGHNPQSLPGVSARPAFAQALTVTATFETGGNFPFQTVTGNFDGAGISFGPIQSNFQSGTLQQLFREFHTEHPRLLKQCFANPQHYDEWMELLGKPRRDQIRWADKRSVGSNKSRLAKPWRNYFAEIGSKKAFQEIMTRQAYRDYGSAMVKAVTWLSGVVPIQIRSFPCLAALFDLCVQQGSLDKAHSRIRRRIRLENPHSEFDLVRIAVEERGRKANKRWRADCISRRLGILEQRPVRVTESGHTSTRNNANLILIRESNVRGLDNYLVTARGNRDVG